MMPVINLNELRIQDDGQSSQWMGLSDNSVVSSDKFTTVHFRNLEQRLINHIQQADVVVGCVAWLTSETILRALAEVTGGISVVVQKEDFLRPDFGTRTNWKSNLRRLYSCLHRLPGRHVLDTPDGLVRSLSVCCDPTLEPVRCVGNYNRDKNPAFPRMHNKFVVFCNRIDDYCDEGEDSCQLIPHTVWTGSFNLTKNATMSLENALVLTDPSIVRAYFSEWEQVLALSEPLDWDSDWCAPEWRIGT